MGKKAQTLDGHVSGQANTPLSRPAHALTFEQVLEEIGCNSENGLSAADATKRHEQYGNNDLGEDGGVQPAKILLRQVANAMTLVRNTALQGPCMGFNTYLGSHLGHGCQFCH